MRTPRRQCPPPPPRRAGRPCFESRALNGVVKLTFPVKVTDRASARESSFLRGVRRRNQAEQGREATFRLAVQIMIREQSSL